MEKKTAQIQKLFDKLSPVARRIAKVKAGMDWSVPMFEDKHSEADFEFYKEMYRMYRDDLEIDMSFSQAAELAFAELVDHIIANTEK